MISCGVIPASAATRQNALRRPCACRSSGRPALFAPLSEHGAQTVRGPRLAGLIEQEGRRDPPGLYLVEHHLERRQDRNGDLDRLPAFLLGDGDGAILDVLAAHLHHVRDALAGVQQKLEGESLFGAYGVVPAIGLDLVICPKAGDPST